MMEKIKVFVIDSDAIYREGLRQVLSRTEDIEVIGESEINEEAPELVTDFSPEIVLVDIGLPLLSGLSLVRQITQHSPVTSVVTMAPYDDD
jgi:DNA-binding NarL/FixJ family response regulator